jgi:uncharacterized membrane protein YtjA (UPF0391 family)
MIATFLRWTGWTLILLVLELVGVAAFNGGANALASLWKLTLVLSLALFLITR